MTTAVCKKLPSSLLAPLVSECLVAVFWGVNVASSRWCVRSIRDAVSSRVGCVSFKMSQFREEAVYLLGMRCGGPRGSCRSFDTRAGQAEKLFELKAGGSCFRVESLRCSVAFCIFTMLPKYYARRLVCSNLQLTCEVQQPGSLVYYLAVRLAHPDIKLHKHAWACRATKRLASLVRRSMSVFRGERTPTPPRLFRGK